MELLSQEEIIDIAKQCGYSELLNWTFEEFEDKVIGYLGDYLNLILEVESKGIKSKITLFIKCLPRYDQLKAEYLKETFFKKEFIMLSTLFTEFHNPEGFKKWRPKSFLIKKDIFALENVKSQGYSMPHHQDTMSFEEIKATVETLARFHAQSYIFEEKKSKELKRSYRIWECYQEYLQEPSSVKDWRDTGRNAVIDFLKVYSKYKAEPNFHRCIESTISSLFDKAMALLKPSSECRNVVIHRDLWANNIFLKKDSNSVYHAMLVDFQSVVYCSPMLDLSSLIYFNTSRTERLIWVHELIDLYYSALNECLKDNGVNVDDVFDKNCLVKQFEKSLVFGITQAALIVPIVTMSKEKREQIFWDPERSHKANVVSRSEEFIEIAKEDEKYRIRFTELLDEIVEKFVLQKIMMQ